MSKAIKMQQDEEECLFERSSEREIAKVRAKAREKYDRDRTLYWELSAREKRIIARLDAEYDKKNNSAENS